MYPVRPVTRPTVAHAVQWLTVGMHDMQVNGIAITGD